MGRVEGNPVGGKMLQAHERDWASLLLSLFLSFLYCAFVAVGGLLGVETVRVAIVWVAAYAMYWLLFSVLQVWWWRKRYGNFWRPVYAWSLLAFTCLSPFEHRKVQRRGFDHAAEKAGINRGNRGSPHEPLLLSQRVSGGSSYARAKPGLCGGR
jgi:hypothetical protein